MMRRTSLMHVLVSMLLLCFSYTLYATPLRCEKAVISGEPGWPPFSYIKDGTLVGVGVDLGKLLFTELNIPVEVLTIQKQPDLEHLLRRGYVDLLVATYDLPRYEKITRLVIPPYFEDTLAVVALRHRPFLFADWHHLMGRAGITTVNRQLGREFDAFAAEYLSIETDGNLRQTFRKLQRREYDYVIGSAQLLRAGMNKYGRNELEFLPMLVSTEPIFFTFSEASPCKMYNAYIRRRIQELIENNVVATLVHKHIEEYH